MAAMSDNRRNLGLLAGLGLPLLCAALVIFDGLSQRSALAIALALAWVALVFVGVLSLMGLMHELAERRRIMREKGLEPR